MIKRIVCADPGRKHDPFGIVGIIADTESQSISVKLARQYTKTPFSAVAKDFFPILQKIKPHFFGMELNNEGKHAIREFRSQEMQVQAIYTVAELNAANRDRKWQSMDKAFTISWLKEIKKQNKISFPEYGSPHMKVLQEQISMIKKYVNLNGSVAYRATNGRHDDLFMAFLLCCHMARMYFVREN